MPKTKKSQESKEQENTNDILESYKELSEKCDVVLERITKRKTKKNKSKK